MRHKSFKANLCPVARSLDTIGEWWSLLIVRDALTGIRRFSDFERKWGEGYLFSRGEKRLQVLDKRTGKPPRLEVQNAKGETVTADDLELVTVKN